MRKYPSRYSRVAGFPGKLVAAAAVGDPVGVYVAPLVCPVHTFEPFGEPVMLLTVMGPAAGGPTHWRQ